MTNINQKEMKLLNDFNYTLDDSWKIEWGHNSKTNATWVAFGTKDDFANNSSVYHKLSANWYFYHTGAGGNFWSHNGQSLKDIVNSFQQEIQNYNKEQELERITQNQVDASYSNDYHPSNFDLSC